MPSEEDVGSMNANEHAMVAGSISSSGLMSADVQVHASIGRRMAAVTTGVKSWVTAAAMTVMKKVLVMAPTPLTKPSSIKPRATSRPDCVKPLPSARPPPMRSSMPQCTCSWTWRQVTTDWPRLTDEGMKKRTRAAPTAMHPPSMRSTPAALTMGLPKKLLADSRPKSVTCTRPTRTSSRERKPISSTRAWYSSSRMWRSKLVRLNATYLRTRNMYANTTRQNEVGRAYLLHCPNLTEPFTRGLPAKIRLQGFPTSVAIPPNMAAYTTPSMKASAMAWSPRAALGTWSSSASSSLPPSSLVLLSRSLSAAAF
mmetsp:Transcript_21590/g.67417  ORF Transcript_21590/g.67417 Transcript_21590/m.67417 type:complete len:312 (-) Transcript_21590:607-1542(-)